MEKYRLSSEEWLVTQLLFLASSDERQSEPLLKYYTADGLDQKPLREMLLSLQEKGILTKEYKIPAPGKKFDPEAVIFNKNFLKDKLKFSLDLAQDLIDHYPPYSGQFQLNNITKYYRDYEEFGKAYGKIIRWNAQKHDEIIELLEWGKENDRINYGICEFIGSKKWDQLERERRDGFEGEMCIIEAL